MRRADHVKELQEQTGAKHVLDSSSETFKADLTALIKELQPTVFYDYLGGSLPAEILALLPPKSALLSVGNLTF